MCASPFIVCREWYASFHLRFCYFIYLIHIFCECSFVWPKFDSCVRVCFSHERLSFAIYLMRIFTLFFLCYFHVLVRSSVEKCPFSHRPSLQTCLVHPAQLWSYQINVHHIGWLGLFLVPKLLNSTLSIRQTHSTIRICVSVHRNIKQSCYTKYTNLIQYKHTHTQTHFVRHSPLCDIDPVFNLCYLLLHTA